MMDLEQRVITCSQCHGTYFDPEALIKHIKNVHCNFRLPINEPTAEKSEPELPILQQDIIKNRQNSHITYQQFENEIRNKDQNKDEMAFSLQGCANDLDSYKFLQQQHQLLNKEAANKEFAISKEQVNKVLDVSEKINNTLTNIKCTLCSETFSNSEGLNHHLSWTLEDSEKDFICQFCRIVFKKKKCLVYHMKSRITYYGN